MTQQEINHWNAIADDVENRNRVDAMLIDMEKRSLRVGAVVAVIEVCTPWAVVEDTVTE